MCTLIHVLVDDMHINILVQSDFFKELGVL